MGQVRVFGGGFKRDFAPPTSSGEISPHDGTRGVNRAVAPVRFLATTRPVRVRPEDVARAEQEGWTFASEVDVVEIPPGRGVVEVEGGKPRLVAIAPCPVYDRMRDPGTWVQTQVAEAIERRGETPVIPDEDDGLRREDIVDTEEIARRLGIQRDTVSQWMRRHQDFPRPLIKGVWDFRDVERWVNSRSSWTKR